MRIKIARVGADFDQAQLAERVGVSRQTIGHWERGGSQPPLGAAVKLAQVTGVTLDWLAEGVSANEETPTANDGGVAARPEGFEPPTFWSVVDEVSIGDQVNAIFDSLYADAIRCYG